MTSGTYVKETQHFLQKLNAINEVPENTILVAIDIVSLYINVPHGDGISASKREIEEYDIYFPSDVILELMDLVLQNIFVIFNKMYKQNQRTTMGTEMAPYY